MTNQPKITEVEVTFSRSYLIEVAKFLNSAAPELYESALRMGSPHAAMSFLEYLWDLSGGELLELGEPR